MANETVKITCLDCNKPTILNYNRTDLLMSVVFKKQIRCKNCNTMRFDWRSTKSGSGNSSQT